MVVPNFCRLLFFIVIALIHLIDNMFLAFLVQDNQGLFISLMMTYIFNAMTNLAIDIRLMAFKFFDLVVQYHPPCFSLYAEKVHEFNHVINHCNYYIFYWHC